MAVAIDARATQDARHDAATSTTGSAGAGETLLTVGAGSNRAIVVQMSFSANPGTVTVTWDTASANQVMTQIILTNNGTGTYAGLWGLVAPVTGNKLLHASWTNSADFTLFAVAFTGVDQTGGTTSFPHSTSSTGSGANPSLAVTSAVGNWTISALTLASSTPSAPSQTQDFTDLVLTNINSAGSDGTGAATVTHSWTATANVWVMAGMDIAVPGGAAALIDDDTYSPLKASLSDSIITVWQ